MIQIIDFKTRVNSEGEPFLALILESDLEMVKSQQSGRFYATAKRASIPSTFTEERCKALIGTQMPGAIKRVECDPYDYTLPETGEVITLSHRYEYIPEEQEKHEQLEHAVFERKNADPKPELA